MTIPSWTDYSQPARSVSDGCFTRRLRSGLVLAIVFACASPALAQTLPATHAYSGLDATSARTKIERGRPRPYGPKFEAAGMPAAPVANPIHVFRSSFRLPAQDLGIADRYDVLFFGETRLVRMRIHLR